VNIFIKTLKEGDETMRETAANYLGDLGDISAVSALVSSQSDNNESVKEASTKSLEKLTYHKIEKIKDKYF